jgi:REP element-mobilizing transposase RayT
MKHAPVTLDPIARATAQHVIEEVCEHNAWTLLAAHARTQHVHVVAGGNATPSDMLRCLKSWTSRRLVERVFVRRGPVWARHASTRFLWTRRAVEAAVNYVLHEQDGGKVEG